MYVVAYGDFMNGWSLVGPFDSFASAERYVSDELPPKHVSASAHIVPLVTPPMKGFTWRSMTRR